MGNFCCCKKKEKKKICLLLLGLDNAGKTVAAQNLAGEPLHEVVPTVGFSVTDLVYKGYTVKIFDLGGGANIRGIWHRYFVDAHGLIFVVDCSDFARLNEVKEVLYNLLSHIKISGKPVLILANKQDHENALDELDLIESLQLEELVNRQQCPTLVESCSATSLSSKRQLDPGIKKGYNWLLSCIIRDYRNLNERVIHDIGQQEISVAKSRQQIIDRLKVIHEAERAKDNEVIELYSDYTNKINGHAKIVSVQSPLESSMRSSHVTYIERVRPIIERPKSATQIIKEQLELEHTERTLPLKIRQNKTEPMLLYGMNLPRSAQQYRNMIFNNRRTLRSAGDSVFVISNMQNTVSHNMGDGDIHRDLFEVQRRKGDFRRNRDNVPSTSKDDNTISVIEVD